MGSGPKMAGLLRLAWDMKGKDKKLAGMGEYAVELRVGSQLIRTTATIRGRFKANP